MEEEVAENFKKKLMFQKLLNERLALDFQVFGNIPNNCIQCPDPQWHMIGNGNVMFFFAGIIRQSDVAACLPCYPVTEFFEQAG